MPFVVSDCLAYLSAQNIATVRLASMFAVLVAGLTSGYLASNRFGLPEYWAKKIMTAVLVFLNWPIVLLVIWPMRLSTKFIWLPIVGVVLMLAATAISTLVFSMMNLDRRSRLTLIMAGGLSNLGYTGGAFVCYALFGTAGLAVANIYLLLWTPAVYLSFFPMLKIREIRTQARSDGFSFTRILDVRMLAIPAAIVAIILNSTGVRDPAFITKFYIVDILVYVASSLSFFAIGLRVNLSRLKNYMNLYFLLGAVKFILTPAVALVIIALLAVTRQNLTDLTKNVIIVLSAAPSAVVMVMMSNVFDLDGPLASAVWVVTTAVFIAVVVPVLFFIFA